MHSLFKLGGFDLPHHDRYVTVGVGRINRSLVVTALVHRYFLGSAIGFYGLSKKRFAAAMARFAVTSRVAIQACIEERTNFLLVH
ncbi:MAG: hypothetical protein Q7K26_04520 [bacterium]|nr:hypothetical protein [bacterium]